MQQQLLSMVDLGNYALDFLHAVEDIQETFTIDKWLVLCDITEDKLTKCRHLMQKNHIDTLEQIIRPGFWYGTDRDFNGESLLFIECHKFAEELLEHCESD